MGLTTSVALVPVDRWVADGEAVALAEFGRRNLLALELQIGNLCAQACPLSRPP